MPSLEKSVSEVAGWHDPKKRLIVIFRFPNRRKTFVMMNYIAHKVVRHQ